MTIERMCELGQVSRAGLYRFDPELKPDDRDMDLRDEIQRIALEFPYYGRPRMVRALQERGWQVGHRRVARIMREDNLLCLRRRKFVIATTNSNHGHRVYPNLAKSMTLTGINQLWIADITYIRLEIEFVYLAVILDAFSRRVIGWALDRTFLGYTFCYWADLKGRSWRYLNVSPSAKSLKREREKLHEMTDHRHCHQPLPLLLKQINRHLKGWRNYFCYGYPAQAFGKIDFYVRGRLKQHLRRRSQRPYRPPEGTSFYAHLYRLGLVRLQAGNAQLPVHACD